MARALLISRARAVLVSALVFACNSDEPLDTTTGVDLTTGSIMTDGNVFTTGPAMEGSTGEEPDDPKQSCEVALECVAGCFIDMGEASEEEDLSCYRECLKGLTTEEYLAMIRLARCVSDDCFARMICSEHGENDDENCRKCIVFDGLLGLNPPEACEAETLACNKK